jgi:hypothetical protein
LKLASVKLEIIPNAVRAIFCIDPSSDAKPVVAAGSLYVAPYKLLLTGKL